MGKKAILATVLIGIGCVGFLIGCEADQKNVTRHILRRTIC